VDCVAQTHGGRHAGNGEDSEDKERYGHLKNSIGVAVKLALHI
jgi:hypothetical protein